jgi:hypothetical protein
MASYVRLKCLKTLRLEGAENLEASDTFAVIQNKGTLDVLHIRASDACSNAIAKEQPSLTMSKGCLAS